MLTTPPREFANVVKYATWTRSRCASIANVISQCGVAAAMVSLPATHEHAASASPCGRARVADSFLRTFLPSTPSVCAYYIENGLTGALCATTRGRGCAANVTPPASGDVYALQAHAPAQRTHGVLHSVRDQTLHARLWSFAK